MCCFLLFCILFFMTAISNIFARNWFNPGRGKHEQWVCILGMASRSWLLHRSVHKRRKESQMQINATWNMANISWVYFTREKLTVKRSMCSHEHFYGNSSFTRHDILHTDIHIYIYKPTEVYFLWYNGKLDILFISVKRFKFKHPYCLT
jgi:hypothetical protein